MVINLYSAKCNKCGELFHYERAKGQLGKHPKTCDNCKNVRSTPHEGTCRKCNKTFIHPVQRGRKPVMCESCRPVKMSENHTRTANCRHCKADFVYAARKGRPPVQCDRCKEIDAASKTTNIRKRNFVRHATDNMSSDDFAPLTGEQRAIRLTEMMARLLRKYETPTYAH